MNRSLPALALLVFLASGTEASACGGWCSQFFASIFGRQQPAPLALRDGIELAVISQNPATNVARGIDTMAAWGIPEAEARRAFDIAYAASTDFSIGRDESYERWKGTIERSRNDSYGYKARRRDRPYIVTERLDDEGLLEINFRPGAPDRYVEAGRMFGIDRDNFRGFFARAYVYFGGRARVTGITGSDDTGADLRSLNHAQRLEFAARSDVGNLASEFYGFVPVVAERAADNRLLSLFALPPLYGPNNLALHLRDDAGPQLQIAGPDDRSTAHLEQHPNDDAAPLDDDSDHEVTQGLITSGHDGDAKQQARRDGSASGNPEVNPLLE